MKDLKCLALWTHSYVQDPRWDPPYLIQMFNDHWPERVIITYYWTGVANIFAHNQSRDSEDTYRRWSTTRPFVIRLLILAPTNVKSIEFVKDYTSLDNEHSSHPFIEYSPKICIAVRVSTESNLNPT